MTGKLIVGKVASEFEIQAHMFCELKKKGVNVRGEVRCSVDGRKVRFDLLVFKEDGSPSHAIEVKPKRSTGWLAMWTTTAQCARYSMLPIPVFMVCGFKEAERFLGAHVDASAHPSGVVWL